MSTKDIFIPKRDHIQSSENLFHWNFGAEPIKAESALFYKDRFEPTGEEGWVFSGSTGTAEEENLYSFLLMVPYLHVPLLERTYKLDDGQGLHVSHGYSIPAPPGFIGFRVVDADDAELTVRLDMIAGTVEGDFNANFKTHRLNPNGTFKLKQDARKSR
jgi:hypothetical protein